MARGGAGAPTSAGKGPTAGRGGAGGSAGVGLPDLTLASFHATAVAPDSTGGVAMLELCLENPDGLVVRNAGDAASPPSATYFALNSEPVTILGAVDVPALTPGQRKTFSGCTTIRLDVPAEIKPGTYNLFALVDAEDAIPESDEDNNAAVTAIAGTRTAYTVTIHAP
jgi:hypothetical protein